MTYDFIYKLKPLYEDLKVGGKGWYRLQWRPIKNGTYNFYVTSNFFLLGRRFCLRSFVLGLYLYPSGAHNGWNRGWKGFTVRIGLGLWDLNFWINWRIIVHKSGPSDVSDTDKRPLDLSRLPAKRMGKQSKQKLTNKGCH